MHSPYDSIHVYNVVPYVPRTVLTPLQVTTKQPLQVANVNKVLSKMDLSSYQGHPGVQNLGPAVDVPVPAGGAVGGAAGGAAKAAGVQGGVGGVVGGTADSGGGESKVDAGLPVQNMSPVEQAQVQVRPSHTVCLYSSRLVLIG